MRKLYKVGSFFPLMFWWLLSLHINLIHVSHHGMNLCDSSQREDYSLPSAFITSIWVWHWKLLKSHSSVSRMIRTYQQQSFVGYRWSWTLLLSLSSVPRNFGTSLQSSATCSTDCQCVNAYYIRLLQCYCLRLLVPRTRTELSQRSFPAAAPTVWNSLLAHLHSTLISRRQFRDRLKSRLFADAYFWSSENICTRGSESKNSHTANFSV